MAAASNESKNELFRLLVAEDGMKVTLEWLAKERGSSHGGAVLAAIQKAGIVEGIRKDAMDQFLAAKAGPGSLLAAQGVEPKAGLDGAWESFFDFSAKKTPERLLDGSVNFHHVRAFIEVKEGLPLARRIPAVPGIEGRNCLGKSLPPPPAKEPSWSLGEGTSFEPGNPDYVIATVRGVVQWKEGKLCVAKEISIRGNVNFSTGDIDVSVPIAISGDIEPGFFVRSTSHITVGGCIQSSRVECGGDLKVGGGILGEPHPTIKVEGNLRAHYVQNARVEVRGDGAIDKVVKDSVLSCGKALSVGEKIVASRVFVGTTAKVGALGSESDRNAQLFLGLNSGAQRQLFRIHAELWQIENSLRQLAIEHKENRQSMALEQRFEGGRGAQKTSSTSSAGSAEMRASSASMASLEARQTALRHHAEELLNASSTQESTAELQIEKNLFEGNEIRVGRILWKIGAELEGRRRIRQETLQRARLSILAVGDTSFLREMGTLATSAELWGMQTLGAGENWIGAIEKTRPDFVLLETRALDATSLASMTTQLQTPRHASTVFCLLLEGTSQETLDALPQADNWIKVSGREDMVSRLVSPR